jgi:hypothetical protein
MPLVASHQNVLPGQRTPFTDIPALAAAATKFKDKKRFELGVPNYWDAKSKEIAWNAAQEWSLQNELSDKMRRLMENAPPPLPPKRPHLVTMQMPEFIEAYRKAYDFKFGLDTDGNSFLTEDKMAGEEGRKFVQMFESNSTQALIDWITYARAPEDVQKAIEKVFLLWNGDDQNEPGTEMELTLENTATNLAYAALDPINWIGLRTSGGAVITAGMAFRAMLKQRITGAMARKAIVKEALPAVGKRAIEGGAGGAVAGGVTEAGKQSISGQETDAVKIAASTGIGAVTGAAFNAALPEIFVNAPKVGWGILRDSFKKDPTGGSLDTFVGRQLMLHEGNKFIPGVDDVRAETMHILDTALAPKNPTNIIFNSLVTQGVDKVEAEASSIVNGSLYHTLAKQFGMTPEALYRAYPFHIKVEEKALLDAADNALDASPTLAQGATPVKIPIKLTRATSMETALKTAREKRYPTKRAMKEDLQAAAQKALTDAGVDINDPEQIHRHAVKSLIKDALYTLNENTNAIGWYSEKVDTSFALSALVHPELATDPKARFAFTWALAVTSNGKGVSPGYKLAMESYATLKATGKLPEDLGAGKEAQAMAKAFKAYNDLNEKWGHETLAKFMNTEYTVREIEAITGIKVDGELVDTKVNGSAILGPKIGNGFFSNLSGNYDKLTMDRWWMRTWGRWTGQLIVDKPEVLAKNQARLDSAVKAISPEDAIVVEQILKVPITSDAETLSKAVFKASQIPANRTALNSLKGGEELRLAGNRVAALKDGQKEAPANGTERNIMRGAAEEALAFLRKNGHEDLQMADLQAGMWYPEKRLYDVAKSADDIDASYADDEAPDFANAAMKYLREVVGMDEATIKTNADAAIAAHQTKKAAEKAAKEAASGRTDGTRRVDGEPGTEAGQPGGVGEPDGGKGFSKEQRKEFRDWSLFDQIRSRRSPDGKQSWTYVRGSDERPGQLRSVGGEKVEIVREYKPQTITKNRMGAAGLPAQKIYETKDPAHFHRTISELNKTNKFFASVQIKGVEDYANMRTFISEDGLSGLALTADGDITSGFNAKPGSGAIHALVELAIQEGGRSGDCFDTVLPPVYAAHGLKPVARLKWDDAEAPVGWDKKTYWKYNKGEPDVVFMAYDPEYRGRGRRNEGPYVKDYTEAKAVQGAEVERNRDVLYQGRGEPAPRGEYDPGKRMARIFANADASTVSHESAHHYLSMVNEMIEGGNVPQSLKDEYASAMNWLGTDTDAWAKMNFEQRRPYHEKFAQGFEVYLRDGEAPTKQLQGIFEAFREWLTKLYTSTDEMGGEISPEARSYFDRIMAGPAAAPGPISMAVGFVGPARSGAGVLEQRYRGRQDYINRLAKGYQDTGVPVKTEKPVPAEAPTVKPGDEAPVQPDATLRQGPIDPVKAQATVDRMLATPPTEPPQGKYIESGTINVERHHPGAKASLTAEQIEQGLTASDDANAVAAYLERIGKEMGYSEDPRTMEDVKREAGDIRKALTPIFGGTQTGLATDVQLYALRSIVATLGDKLAKLADRIEAGDASPENLAEYQKTGMSLVAMQGTLTKNVRETARALAQQRYIATIISKEDTAMLGQELANLTDPEAIKWNAKALAAKLKNNTNNTKLTPEQKKVKDAEAIGQSMKRRSGLEAAVEYWVAQILTGPTTHIINMAANAAKQSYDMGLIHPLAATVGSIRTKFATNQERVYFEEIIPGMVGTAVGLRDGFLALGHVLKTGQSKLASDPTLMTKSGGAGRMPTKLGQTGAVEDWMGRRKWAQSPGGQDVAYGISRAATASFTLLTAEDELFKTMAYRSELAKLATRRTIDQGLDGADRAAVFEAIMENPPEDLHRRAFQFAKESTFQDEAMGGGIIGFMASKAKEITARYPVTKFLVPFISTPANVVNAGIDASLLAIANPKIIKGLQAGGAEFDMAAAKILGGIVMTGLGIGLYQMGLITGDGPKDPEQRKMMESEGWQKNSFRVGGKYLSYDRLDPLATPLVAIATFMDRSRFQRRNIDGVKDMIGATFAAGSHFFELPFVQGINDLIKAFDPEQTLRQIPKMAGKTAAGFIPFSSLLATIGRGDTPSVAGSTGQEIGFGGDGTTMDMLDEFWHQVETRSPWARDGMRPGRYWDGEIKMAPSFGWAAPLSPMPGRDVRKDYASEQLNKYGIIASEPTPILNIGEGISINLLDLDGGKGMVYDAYLVDVGKARKAAVLDALKDSLFKKLDAKDMLGEKPLKLQKAIGQGREDGMDIFLTKTLKRLVAEGKIEMTPMAMSLAANKDRLIRDIKKGKVESDRDTGRFVDEAKSRRVIKPSGTGVELQ